MAYCAAEGCGRWRPNLLVGAARVGIRFDSEWYCSSGCVEAEATRRLREVSGAEPAPVPAFRRVRLGALLMHQQAITKDQLTRGLVEQERTGFRLGRVLYTLGVASKTGLVKALATQAGVDYLTNIEASKVREAPGRFSQRAVRQLGLVPFEADEEKRCLKVACCAPVPRQAVNAVRSITEWTVAPFLVWDDDWQELAASYGHARMHDVADDDWTTAESVSDAAAHIARRAARGQVRRMHYARCAPFVWVRLEGSRSENVWLPLSDRRRDAWRAERTSH